MEEDGPRQNGSSAETYIFEKINFRQYIFQVEEKHIEPALNIRPDLRFINQMKHNFLIFLTSWWMSMKLADFRDLCLDVLRTTCSNGMKGYLNHVQERLTRLYSGPQWREWKTS
ncbi:hypothetical protein HID58_013533 [Brassica napus]|uniref:Uncharacterized protein n=1 Tax=Brassica napus TaxID=3708 RepID=A0ABQ8E462_BRANA|nr:hypothetical protein HID58_013533 [Brassica napus]